jgi:cytochrome P450
VAVTITDRSHPLAVDDDDTYDPFAAFNAHMGAGKVTSPYPAYAELRGECPVHKADEVYKRLGFDGVVGMASVATAGNGRAVYTHQGVDQAFRDRDGFSVQGYQATIGPLLGRTILEMDEPEHMRVRRLVAEAFTPAAMETWREHVIGPIVHQHLDRFADRGSVDLVAEFTFPFPVHVIAGMLGLPDEDLRLFHRRAVELITIGVDAERSLRASRCLADYFTGIIDDRRANPRDDIISLLAHARLEGEELTDSEIIDFCRLLLPAGAETTYRSSSILLLALLQHPDQLAALTADRSLMPQAIEEGLRWDAPLTGISRIAVHDTELDGVPVEAGTPLNLCLGAANRDPARHERPDEFDIFRKPRPHMAFGFGNHICLGMHLARMETVVAMNAVLDRLPGLRLDPAAEPVHVEGMVFRAPPRLDVVWDA